MAAGPSWLPLQTSASIDGDALLFTVAASVAGTLAFGISPALTATRAGLAENLKDGGRGGGSDGPGRSQFRAALVVGEVALALLLAISATLSARGLVRLQAVDPGFRPEGVLAGYLTLPSAGYASPAERTSFAQALVDRLQLIPGVTAAGMVSHLPFSNAKSGGGIVIEGVPPPRPGEKPIVFQRTADPGYFAAIGARLLRGRQFDCHDPPGHPVAIVNETMARNCWPNQDPLGKRFGDGEPGHWITVVGVIADMRQTSLADEPDREAFVPYAQSPGATMALVVRTAGDPLRMAPAMRAALREQDKDLPVSGVIALADNLSKAARARRFSTALLGFFALLALVLAVVGIYGVISYSVACRTHEIAIRTALGASRRGIESMVVGWALKLAGGGVALGIAGALAVTRLLHSMLYGVSATDPLVFAGVSLFLLAVSSLAAYIPARRAARVDPYVALRNG
jgi:predicted permease